jgi:protein-L-isoaspartate(D-aspartate) O-methyltransferase
MFELKPLGCGRVRLTGGYEVTVEDMANLDESAFTQARLSMVELIQVYVQLSSAQLDRNRLDRRVIAAMAEVPRHDFVPPGFRDMAYEDSPLPIGCDKTVSQPFMVALMTDLLKIGPRSKVLEIGTGLGYHAAILAGLAKAVFTVEIHDELAGEGRARLDALGYDNIQFKVGDGAQGWPEHAPFDRILVTAAPELLPAALIQQLKPGGRMVVPAGLPDDQQLLVIDKDADGRISTQEVLQVVFSPLINSH